MDKIFLFCYNHFVITCFFKKKERKMEKTNDSKRVNLIALLFASVYMISYVTRINFGAIIAEMEDALSMSRSLISVALTCNSVAYGFGQLVSGFAGDKFSPKRLISLGFIITISMNLLISSGFLLNNILFTLLCYIF